MAAAYCHRVFSGYSLAVNHRGSDGVTGESGGVGGTTAAATAGLGLKMALSSVGLVFVIFQVFIIHVRTALQRNAFWSLLFPFAFPLLLLPLRLIGLALIHFSKPQASYFLFILFSPLGFDFIYVFLSSCVLTRIHSTCIFLVLFPHTCLPGAFVWMVDHINLDLIFFFLFIYNKFSFHLNGSFHFSLNITFLLMKFYFVFWFPSNVTK